MSRINHTACMGSLPVKGRKVLTQVDIWLDSRLTQSGIALPPRLTIKAQLLRAVNKAKETLRVYYLQGKMDCHSLIFSILGFLAGIFTVDFGLPLSAKIGCGLALIVGGGLILPLTIASFGPGLIQ
ncbi:hypothetical protein F4604DRAFT_1691909 [Suillus subluteus]|nr:hypothetical protein F4604DRAFT_1691909 [Suillus subluteus]